MNDKFSFAVGFINYFEPKEDLAKLFKDSQIDVRIGKWALTIENCSIYFKIAYVGNITPDEPYDIEVSANAEPSATVALWCEKLSRILKTHKIVHEFTHCSQNEDEIGTYEYARV